MTSSTPKPPGSDTNAGAEARVTAMLADVAAGVDDPRHGEGCRQILDDHLHKQRAPFDPVQAPTAVSPSPDTWPQLAAVLLLVAAATATVVVAVP